MEVLGERRGNIEDQTAILQLLNHFCTDYNLSKECLKIQKRIRIQLFNIGTNPMKRGVIFFQLELDTSNSLVYNNTEDPKLNQSLNITDERLPLKKLDRTQTSKPLPEGDVLLNKIKATGSCLVKIFKPSNRNAG